MSTPTDAKSLTENAATHTLTATSRLYGESNLGTGQGYFTIPQLKAALDAISGPAELFGYLTVDLANVALGASGTVVTPSGTEHFFGPGFGTVSSANYWLNGSATGSQADAMLISFTATDTSLVGATVFSIYGDVDTSYNIGDGGLVRYEIWSESGGAPNTLLGNTPDIIARTSVWTEIVARAKYDGAGVVWSQYGEGGTKLKFFRRVDFTSPISVSIGTKYFLRVVQRNNDPELHSVAHKYLVYRASLFDRTTLDPNLDATFDWKVYYERSSVVTEDTNAVPVFTVWGATTDQGQGYYQTSQSGALGSEADLCRNVDGTKRVRQVWNPNNNYTITSLGLWAGRNGAGASDLSVSISQDGNTLHTAYITGSSVPQLPASATISDIQADADRASTSIPNIQVVSGLPVTFELSTSGGTDYEIISGQDGGYSGYFASNTTLDGHMSFTDNGTDWTDSTINDILIDILVQET